MVSEECQITGLVSDVWRSLPGAPGTTDHCLAFTAAPAMKPEERLASRGHRGKMEIGGRWTLRPTPIERPDSRRPDHVHDHDDATGGEVDPETARTVDPETARTFDHRAIRGIG